jgi:hypothetical protein
MALTFIPSDLIEQAAREEHRTDSDRQYCSGMLRQACEESLQVKEIQRSVNGLIAYDSTFVSFETVRFQEGAREAGLAGARRPVEEASACGDGLGSALRRRRAGQVSAKPEPPIYSQRL